MEQTSEAGRLGNPDGMEAFAADLLRRAESISGVMDAVSRQVAAMTFEGPAAAWLREATEARQREAARVLGSLEETASRLRRAAAEVREEMAEAERARLRAEGLEL